MSASEMLVTYLYSAVPYATCAAVGCDVRIPTLMPLCKLI